MSSHFGYCTPEPKQPSCIDLNDDPCCGSGPSSPKSCGGDCDQCEDCIEDHDLCADEVDCVKDCNECLDEHEQACGQHGPACVEMCDDCDFHCFDCIDWKQFVDDKDLGLSYSVPLLGQENSFTIDPAEFDASMDLTPFNNPISPQDSIGSWTDLPVAPINVSMHHQCMDNYWSAMLQPQLCSDPNVLDFNTPALGWASQMPQFSCHPAAIHAQQQLPQPVLPQSASTTPFVPQVNTSDQKSQGASPPNLISCQWLMPCGTTCSATFATITDLKKHLKSTHCPKGTTTCAWNDCTATFGSEAALTGHISKKHLSSLLNTDASTSADPNSTTTTASLPFKCTFPGCTKSFMYKQVLMTHLQSHTTNGNKAWCHICNAFLNAEGSNFRRHMASHRPKHEHLVCKWHHLGCKRRFPRLDNLRRHESCCKFGKKAAMHHHHYHLHKGEASAH
jgi:hypothetical protein